MTLSERLAADVWLWANAYPPPAASAIRETAAATGSSFRDFL